jgi:hypothetical protein
MRRGSVAVSLTECEPETTSSVDVSLSKEEVTASGPRRSGFPSRSDGPGAGVVEAIHHQLLDQWMEKVAAEVVEV